MWDKRKEVCARIARVTQYIGVTSPRHFCRHIDLLYDGQITTKTKKDLGELLVIIKASRANEAKKN